MTPAAPNATAPPTRCPQSAELGASRPHLHQDWAHPAHICTGTGLTPPTSAPELGSPRPHLHRDSARPAHICAGTGHRARRLLRTYTTAELRATIVYRARCFASDAERAAYRRASHRITSHRIASHRIASHRIAFCKRKGRLGAALRRCLHVTRGMGSRACLAWLTVSVASTPGLGSPLPHLHRDWARPCHICTGTGLAPAVIIGAGP